MAKFFSHYYDMDMLDRELSVKGWNWGTASFNGGVMNFQTGTNDAFEIPLNYVNQCNPGKNEVTLEFHPVRTITKLPFISTTIQLQPNSLNYTERLFWGF